VKSPNGLTVQVGRFKINHPEVYGLPDVGYVLFGKIGREVLATCFTICECRALYEPR
jgi:hypothetical protein